MNNRIHIGQLVLVLGIIGLWLMASSSLMAKDIDYSPDVTSELYWQNHHIALVRIESIDGSSSNPGLVMKVVEDIGEPMPDAEYRIPLSYLWFGLGEQGNTVSTNQMLVLYLARKRPAPFVVTPVLPHGLNVQLIETLKEIAGIRKSRPVLKPLEEGIGSPRSSVAVYCMRSLLAQSTLALTPELVDELRKKRQDKKTDVGTRVLANKLLIKSNNLGAEESYGWLKDAVMDSSGLKWQDLSHLVQEMLAYREKRQETIRFLIDLVGKEESPLDLKIAIYGTLSAPDVLDYKQPEDETSTRIMNAYLAMLRDKEPVVRKAAAIQIRNISYEIKNDSVKTQFQKKALKELENASIGEKDATVIEVLKATMHQIDSKQPTTDQRPQ